MNKTDQVSGFSKRKKEHRRNKTLGQTLTSDIPQQSGMSIPLEDLLKPNHDTLPSFRTHENSTLTPKPQPPLTSFRQHANEDGSADMRITYTFKQFRKDSVKEHTKAILPTVRKIK